MRLGELKELLLARDYPALMKARSVPRHIALRRIIKSKRGHQKRPIFAIRYDPRLPSLTNIQAKYWRSMAFMDQHMKEVFPQPPLTAFKRQKNLRDMLIRAKVPEPKRLYEKRSMKGMAKCGHSCTACPFIKTGKQVKIKRNAYWNINTKVNCESYNVIYMLECEKDNCTNNRYIGETGRLFKFRLSEHKGYIINKDETQATGSHFNLPGHNLGHLKATILEQVNKNCEEYRKRKTKFLH
jgi:hypothetical protein